jgi:glycyl-tRNA synthetase
VAVGLADRLDSLVGLFAAGLAPSGSADPFGLRRAALGVVLLLTGREIDLDLRPALQTALESLPAEVQPAPEARARLLDDVLTFIAGRQRPNLLDGGYRHDIVDAVLAEQAHNPHRAQQAVVQLAGWMARPDWPPTLAAYARCVRITRDQKELYPLDSSRLAEPAERDLLAALETASAALPSSPSVDAFFAALLPMIPAISQFFDKVLVMADDPAVRANRLGLLQRIAGLAQGVADFSKLEGF